MRSLPVVVLCALALVACGSSTEAIEVEPSILPTAAEATVVESALIYTSDAAISPSGSARVAPADGQWCLEDAAELRCVEALAGGSAAHGIVWRPDETAIAVTWGSQDSISIIDFDAGTSVETDLDRHRILAWSPDGSDLVGLDIDEPGQLSRIDPVTLEASSLAPYPSASVPQLLWATADRLWGATPRVPEVFTVSPGDDLETIEATLAEQLLLSTTADGELLLTLDDDIIHGVEGPPNAALTLFEWGNDRAIPVELPPSIDQGEIDHAQLATDGRAILVLHGTDDGDALSSAAIDPETREASAWSTVLTWSSGEPMAPARYASNGELRWTGGDTAWVITDSEQLLELSLR